MHPAGPSQCTPLRAHNQWIYSCDCQISSMSMATACKALTKQKINSTEPLTWRKASNNERVLGSKKDAGELWPVKVQYTHSQFSFWSRSRLVKTASVPCVCPCMKGLKCLIFPYSSWLSSAPLNSCEVYRVTVMELYTFISKRGCFWGQKRLNLWFRYAENKYLGITAKVELFTTLGNSGRNYKI